MNVYREIETLKRKLLVARDIGKHAPPTSGTMRLWVREAKKIIRHADAAGIVVPDWLLALAGGNPGMPVDLLAVTLEFMARTVADSRMRLRRAP